MNQNTSPFPMFTLNANTPPRPLPFQNNPNPTQSGLFASNIPTTSHFQPSAGGLLGNQQPILTFPNSINGQAQHGGNMLGGGLPGNTPIQQANRQSHDIFANSQQSRSNTGMLGLAHGQQPTIQNPFANMKVPENPLHQNYIGGNTTPLQSPPGSFFMGNQQGVSLGQQPTQARPLFNNPSQNFHGGQMVSPFSGSPTNVQNGQNNTFGGAPNNPFMRNQNQNQNPSFLSPTQAAPKNPLGNLFGSSNAPNFSINNPLFPNIQQPTPTGMFGQTNPLNVAKNNLQSPLTNKNPNTNNNRQQEFYPYGFKNKCPRNPSDNGRPQYVACITASDQLQGFSKEEVRILTIQTHGYQSTLPHYQQQANPIGSIGSIGNPLFKNGNLIRPTALGVASINNSIPFANPASLYGNQAQNIQPLCQPHPTNPPSLFGQQQPSLFAQNNQQNQNSALFRTQPNNMLVQPLFGGQTNQQQTPSFPFQQIEQNNQAIFNQSQPAAFSQIHNPLYQTVPLINEMPLYQYQPTIQGPSTGESSNEAQLNLNLNFFSMFNDPSAHINTQELNNYDSDPFSQAMREDDLTPWLRGKYWPQFKIYERPSIFSEAAYLEKKRKENEPQFDIIWCDPTPSTISSNKKEKKQAWPFYIDDKTRRKMQQVRPFLPIIGSFSTFPSIDKLKLYSSEQLKSVSRFRIWNQFGSIQFKEPVSLVNVNLENNVKIHQDCIEITDQDLQSKKFWMVFNNFGNYSEKNEEERKKIMKRMRKWIDQCDLREIRHDVHNGDLVVEVIK